MGSSQAKRCFAVCPTEVGRTRRGEGWKKAATRVVGARQTGRCNRAKRHSQSSVAGVPVSLARTNMLEAWVGVLYNPAAGKSGGAQTKNTGLCCSACPALPCWRTAATCTRPSALQNGATAKRKATSQPNLCSWPSTAALRREGPDLRQLLL